MTVEQLVAGFELTPHPEGGYYRETYRSTEVFHTDRGLRSASTAILFLLPAGTRSRLHRIRSDEVWHVHLGGPMRLIELHPDGRVVETVLGTDLAAGQRVQHVVPAGVWFGGYPEPGSPYALVGCTVSPGFDFADFELGDADELARQFPAARGVIEALTGETPSGGRGDALPHSAVRDQVSPRR